MPRFALVLALFGYLALFVIRSIIQWRQTGSTGIKGFHGAIGSTPWFAGVLVSLGFLLAPLAPGAALLGWPGGSIQVASGWLHVAGAGFVLIGIAGGLVAQLTMGDSWRIGVDESDRTKLVTGGLFARVRNPIFSFMGLSMLGILWMVPNVWALAACAISLAGIELQVRAVEEPYLLRAHGDAYVRYAARVGRFAPGIGRRAAH